MEDITLKEAFSKGAKHGTGAVGWQNLVSGQSSFGGKVTESRSRASGKVDLTYAMSLAICIKKASEGGEPISIVGSAGCWFVLNWWKGATPDGPLVR